MPLAVYFIPMENGGVLWLFRRHLVIGLAVSSLTVMSFSLCAQEATPPQLPASSAAPLRLNLPDSTGGLEHLAKEIIKAEKEGATARATALAESMILPNPAAWYLQTFGPDIANDEGAKYAASQKNLPNEIVRFFFGAIQNHFTDVGAARFGESCDDNAGESAFGTLQLRLEPVPLYELRLKNGNQFLRLFALAYVDDAFRYVLAPRVPDHFPFVQRPAASPKTQTGDVLPDQSRKTLRVGGNVQAARIIQRVQPEYPGAARSEHLQGTVRLHAIIGKDGSISRLVVLHGHCSLAKASVEAVRKWRYTPTLLLGQPVEIDTTIDVIFSLNY
jgi:TonB family protein